MNDDEHDRLLWHQSLYPPTRLEAIELNLKYYFTGDPCKHGHRSSRRVSDRHCTECSRIKTRRFNREHKPIVVKRWQQWYAQHKDDYNFKRKLKKCLSTELP